MIFNMVGGGGGSLKDTDAVLIVSVPTGSTVTATKGGVTLTPTIWVQNADNTTDTAIFSIKASTFDSNPWTVMATLNGDTASDTVVINSAKEYGMELSFRVPSGYTEVEFLQSTGTQYLKLPIAANSVKGGEVKYMVVSSVSYAYLFGSNNDSSAADGSGAFGLSLYGNYGFNYCGVKTNISGQATNTEYVLSFSVTSGSQTYIINGTTYNESTSGTPSTVKLFLYGLSYKGSPKTAELAKAKIYYFTLTDSNGDNLCELVPCYRNSDSVAGMWDIVSKTFLTNAGSGTFTVGADV